MKTLDVDVKIVVRDGDTGKTMTMDHTYEDVYVNEGKIRLPKIELDVSEMVESK